MASDNARQATGVLLSEDVVKLKVRAPVKIAMAQAFATLAVAEAIERLAAAVEARSR